MSSDTPPLPTVAEAMEYARDLPDDCFADRVILTLAQEVERLQADEKLRSGYLIGKKAGREELQSQLRELLGVPSDSDIDQLRDQLP